MDKRFFEASPDCVKLIALDGTLQFMNANGRCLMDFDDAMPVAGMMWLEFWPPRERAAVSAAIEKASSGGTSRFTASCPTAKGVFKWWDVIVTPLAREDGSIEAILAISRDITHIKKVERTLKESEARFRALANTIPQLAWLADTTGSVFWYNEPWFEYTGKTFAEMKGYGWRSVHHPEHVERVVEKFTDSLGRGEEWEDVFPLLGADGEYRWFLSRARPFRNAEGVAEVYCGTNTDITDQRHLSQRLRQLVRLIELSHEAILVWDMEQGIVSWNRGCEELYGYTKTEAIGANSHQLLQTRHPVTTAEFDRSLIAEGSWSGELLHFDSEGAAVWVDSRQEVIRIAGRHFVLETNRDITERRRADQTRDLLVAELNHRVKNTLAIVQSIATQTARRAPGLEQFVANFNGRLQSLALTHTILTDAEWLGASLRQLVLAHVKLHDHDDKRFVVEGEDVSLPPQTALQFALNLHELATNAAKYGALSNDSGRVLISWNLLDTDPPQIEFTWQERDGPPVKPVRNRGFGLNLIEWSGKSPTLEAKVDFEPAGITARFKATLAGTDDKPSNLFNPGKRLLTLRTPDLVGSCKRNRKRDRILMVEREPTDAMLLDEVLYDAGYATLGPVSTAKEASRKLDLLNCELAIVDVDGVLGEVGATLAVLEKHAVKTILVGSARRLAELPDLGAGLPRLIKPLQPQNLMQAIATAMAMADKSRGPARTDIDGPKS